MPAPYHSIFYRPDALPDAQTSQSTEGSHIICNGTPQNVNVIKFLIPLMVPLQKKTKTTAKTSPLQRIYSTCLKLVFLSAYHAQLSD